MATAVDYGGMYAPNNSLMGYLNRDTRIGDEVVTQGLSRDLEAYYNKTDSAEDKAKALELLTSLRVGNEGRNDPIQRPQTAMPSVGHYHSNPYTTSYQRDYPIKEQPFTGATRPMTSHGFRPGKIGKTTYGEEYREKPNRPASPVRSGSSSGNRNNKPHPLEAFMVWRLPSKAKAEQHPSPWSEAATDDMMNQVHKRLCQSTYQTDYLGIPQGFQLKSAYTLPPDWKADIPYTLDSVARYSYQNPTQQEELKLPVDRYGSNKKKHLAVDGTIPTASSRYNHIKQRTTYDRHYNDNSAPVVQQIKDVSRRLEAEALKKYYDKAAVEDKDTIRRMLDAYQSGEPAATKPVHVPAPPSARPSLQMSHRSNPPSTPMSDKNNSVSIKLSDRGSVKYRTPTPARKPGSRIAATPITDFEHVTTEYTVPVQVGFPMQVPIPQTPVSAPFTPPNFLS